MAVESTKILLIQKMFQILRQPALSLVSSYFAFKFKLIWTRLCEWQGHVGQ